MQIRINGAHIQRKGGPMKAIGLGKDGKQA
jgi:hypothetical protein